LLQVRYVGLTSLYMAVMMSDGLDVVTVELELEQKRICLGTPNVHDKQNGS